MKNKSVASAISSSFVLAAAVGLTTYFILNNNRHEDEPGVTHLGDIDGSSSRNPCDDFYEYACGKWIKENPLSNEADSITTATQAQLNIDKFLWELLTIDPRTRSINISPGLLSVDLTTDVVQVNCTTIFRVNNYNSSSRFISIVLPT
ncbi:Neprilysin-2 [Schistosoma japonicum]|nr:Neprilysin-2 [Schistosoma japonicum]